MNRIKKIKLIILIFISNVALAAHDNKYLASASTANTMKTFAINDNKEKAADNDKTKRSEFKFAVFKLGDYLSQVTDIPALQNLIKKIKLKFIKNVEFDVDDKKQLIKLNNLKINWLNRNWVIIYPKSQIFLLCKI